LVSIGVIVAGNSNTLVYSSSVLGCGLAAVHGLERGSVAKKGSMWVDFIMNPSQASG
jgi:hypothetical protein